MLKIENYTGVSIALQHKLIYTLAVFVLVYALRFLLLRMLFRRDMSLKVRYRWRKATIYASTILFIIVAGRIWLEGISNLMTYMGLLSAGVAVALKHPIENMAGWWFILWKRPFDVGDRIQIGDQRGDVIDQRLMMFSLMEIGNWVDAEQSTGRVIHIPNGEVFRKTIANYHHGFRYIWNEIPVLITFESDWRLADKILTAIARKHSKNVSEKAAEDMEKAAQKFMIFYQKLTPIVYTSVQDSGVQLTIRYLCDPRKRRSSEHKLWRHILSEFENAENIDLAYPTTRFYQTEAASGVKRSARGGNATGRKSPNAPPAKDSPPPSAPSTGGRENNNVDSARENTTV
jgi:small-conductance mechanosensitive channel